MSRVKNVAALPKGDPQVHAVIDDLRKWAKRLPDRTSPNGVNPSQKLNDLADRLELSNQALIEDVYGYCQELINPHIKPDDQGMLAISQDSLIPSVAESLQYLIEFWKANKDKPEIDLCL